MSCPHPRGPVERIVGDVTELVCPDCHARFAAAGEPDVDEFIDDEALPDVSVTNVDRGDGYIEPMSREAILAVFREAVDLGIIESGDDLEEMTDGASYALIEGDTVRIGYPLNSPVPVEPEPGDEPPTVEQLAEQDVAELANDHELRGDEGLAL